MSKQPNTMPLDMGEREALWAHIKNLEAIVHRMAISKAKPVNSEEWKELVRQSREVLEMKP